MKCIRQNVRNSGTNGVKKYLREKIGLDEKEKIEQATLSSFEKGLVSEDEKMKKLINEFCINGELVLKGMNVAELSDLIFDKNIRLINVSDNRLQEINPKIQKLQESLRMLYLNGNQLECIPGFLGNLYNLECLEAKNNKISAFELESKNSYPGLNYLDLSVNKFTKIPKEIFYLRSLRTLHLSYNKISSIEPVFEANVLEKLEVLDVSNNAIDDVSDNVFSKTALNYLNLENNNLTKIPTLMGFMKLSGLKVDGNPLKLMKRQVIEKGTVAIMEFLRTKHTGPLPEKKMVPEEVKPEEVTYEKHIQNNRRQVPYQEDDFEKTPVTSNKYIEPKPQMSSL